MQLHPADSIFVIEPCNEKNVYSISQQPTRSRFTSIYARKIEDLRECFIKPVVEKR